MKQLVFGMAVLSSVLLLQSMEIQEHQPTNEEQRPACKFTLVTNKCNFLTGTTPEKVAKVGKTLLIGGVLSKLAEFSYFSCCTQEAYNMSAGEACCCLWFPACDSDSCGNVADCCLGVWDWGTTVATFTGPILWIAGSLIHKQQNCIKRQNYDSL